ncbi:MAG: hypothetical protein F9K44_03010 [Hyphomicrobiaceae bacterium]|nr:MAG: hypothetical protein F9K44_03010 [Hyphomicrobiaceae bacterium]
MASMVFPTPPMPVMAAEPSTLVRAKGDMDPARMIGSWAGAFGHTQFIPTTYLADAVDHDGDGRRDLIGSHADALASTANYLRVSEAKPPTKVGAQSKSYAPAWSCPGAGLRLHHRPHRGRSGHDQDHGP